MRKRIRLPSRERRQAIVTAVQGAFADKGFDGTTTRELARAAGFSEALLYKHFPSKESLYVAMLEACADGPMAAEFTRVLALPPSTSTLVVLVHFLTSHFVLCEDCRTTMHRLALRSLLEDAEFVRLGAKQFEPADSKGGGAPAAAGRRAPGNPSDATCAHGSSTIWRSR
jgi:AcrR family transcriptional regulator